MSRKRWRGVSIPESLTKEIDKVIEADDMFTSRSNFIVFVVKQYLRNNK